MDGKEMETAQAGGIEEPENFSGLEGKNVCQTGTSPDEKEDQKAEDHKKRAVKKRTVRKKSTIEATKKEKDTKKEEHTDEEAGKIDRKGAAFLGSELERQNRGVGGNSMQEDKRAVLEKTGDQISEDTLPKYLRIMKIDARNGLNCRIEPGMNQKIIASFEDGTKVYVLDDSNPDWYKVWVPYEDIEYTGYCSSRFLIMAEEGSHSGKE